MAVALVGAQTLALVLRVVLGRLLPLDDFGRFSLLVESVNFIATVMALGLPAAMMRFGVREKRLDYHFAGALRLLVGYAAIV